MSAVAAMPLPRIVQTELLDELAVDDPRAQRSRRDNRRVHRVMGTCAILRKVLRGLRLDRFSGGFADALLAHLAELPLLITANIRQKYATFAHACCTYLCCNAA